MGRERYIRRPALRADLYSGTSYSNPPLYSNNSGDDGGEGAQRGATGRLSLFSRLLKPLLSLIGGGAAASHLSQGYPFGDGGATPVQRGATPPERTHTRAASRGARLNKRSQ